MAKIPRPKGKKPSGKTSGLDEEKFREQVLGAFKREEKRETQTEEVLRETEKQRIKELQSDIPSKTYFIIALVLAIAYDALDAFLTIFGVGTFETIEWVFDFGMQFAMYKLLGKFYTKFAWIEFVPLLDTLPWYTITVLYAWWKSSKVTSGYSGFMSKIGRPGGPSHAQGVIAFLSLILAGGLISFFIFGLPIAILYAAIMLAIMLFYFDATRGFAVLLVALLILGAVAYAILMASGLSQNLVGTDTTVGKVLGAPQKAYTSMALFFSKFAETAKRSWQRQVYAATGDYYTGKVDKNAEEKLGVYLENLKQADPKLYEDQPVTIYATLVAKTLDDPINISMACKSGNTSGVLYPQDAFSVDVYEEQDIDCTFEPKKLGVGSKIFEMSATFDFKTMAYVKTYFMNKDTLRSLRRQEIDPLDQYGITDKSPSATHTAGPVMIGMSVGSPPIGVDKKEPKLQITLGITVDNIWQGKVNKITKLFVIIPAEFVIKDLSSIGIFKKKCSDIGQTDQGCDDGQFNVYQINPYAEGAKNLKFDTFKTYRIFLEVPSSQYTRLLGGTPLATKYFKVLVEYEYALEKKKTINILKPQGTGGLLGSTADIIAPKIEGAVIKIPKPDGIALQWTTDEISNDKVEYWSVTTPHTVLTYQEFGFAKEHSANLAGLGSGRTYGFKIISMDNLSNSRINPSDSFTTT